MKIPTRIRPENETQKHCKLTWCSAFGRTVLETFLDAAEIASVEKAGIVCEML